ncbi:MAG: hypothetical protein J7647_24595 [Cyanobacteria bacterium SBLK]|nr:hypothetical protein [Cyanobacteria bacterium SBLK]
MKDEKSMDSIWFDRLQNSLYLTAADQTAIAQHILSILDPSEEKIPLPQELQGDRSPRIVFFSASDTKTAAQVVWGTGLGIEKAIANAITQIQLLFPENAPQWFKIDIVQEALSVQRRNSRHPLKLDRSLYGLAFDEASKIAFLPEELVAQTLIDRQQRLLPKKIIAYLENHPDRLRTYHQLLESTQITLYRFSSTSFFCNSKKLVSLYRGHRVLNPQKMTPDLLLEGAIAAWRYLQQTMGGEGEFLYHYNPQNNKVGKNYNILHHTGTLYALLELYEETREEELLETILNGISYLLQFVQPCPKPGIGTCIVEEGWIKLGGNALAAIALSKYTQLTNDKPYIPLILELGKRLQSLQQENGEFISHKQSYPEGKILDFVSDIYPGEAIFALLCLYRLTEDSMWLESAENGVRYLLAKQTKSKKPIPPDPWLLWSLNQLFRDRNNPEYYDFVMSGIKAIARGQNLQTSYLDWLGGIYQPPRSLATARRMTALCSACDLAIYAQNPAIVQQLLTTLQLGIAFQLQTQFYPESVFYFADPQRILGAFHHSLTDFEIRIDCLQYNILSLLGLYRIFNIWDKQ